MPNDNLVLVDTSIWIAYLRNTQQRLTDTVDFLLTNGRVASAAIILAELAHGAHTDRETHRMQEYFRPLHWIASMDAHWETAGKLASRLRRNGKSVNLTDCYIAALAASADATIYSLDKHFGWIADTGGCKLFQAP